MTVRMWPFVGFGKIGERLELSEAAHRKIARVPWVVTEKVHGANLCWLTDGAEIVAAKRKAILDETEDFFGHRALRERSAGAIGRVFAGVRQNDAEAEVVSIYGEICGGSYPHPDVAPVAGVEAVQTGVYYSPQIEFCAFDIAVFAAGETRFLDYDVAGELLERAGMLFARPLFVGRYEDAVAFPLGFESRVPAQLGLPAIAGNRAEGIVVKTQASLVVDGARPIVKRKIAEFAEDERFHQAQKRTRRPESGLREELRALLNEPRLRNAESKIGRVRRDDEARRAELTGELVADVRAELVARHGDAWRALASDEKRALEAELERAAAALVSRSLSR